MGGAGVKMYPNCNRGPSDEDGPRHVSEIIRELLALYGDTITTADTLVVTTATTSSETEVKP